MWIFNNVKITSSEGLPDGVIGFVYVVVHSSGKKYIGKKSVISNKTLPPLKGTKRKRKVVKESDWMKYYGSNQEIKQMIKEGKSDEFVRYILEFAYTKKHLTYLETKYLFKYEVLENPDLYWNDNISAKFFRKDIPKNS